MVSAADLMLNKGDRQYVKQIILEPHSSLPICHNVEKEMQNKRPVSLNFMLVEIQEIAEYFF